MYTFFCFIFLATSLQAFEHLEVMEIRKSNPSYEDFCQRTPSECHVYTNSIINFEESTFDVLENVNLLVNQNVSFILDTDQYGKEEYWSLPTSMGGDCEDNALAKRKILVEDYGFPRSSLRMVTAFHKDMFYAHALLAVFTNQGVFILDQDESKVVKSVDANYIFESLELPGRRWMRFVQEW